MKSIVLYFLISFAVSAAVAPFVLWVLRKLKAKQTVLHYVEQHAGKSGTPTMGGLIFILPIVTLAWFFVGKGNPLCIIAILAGLGYATLGFLDDFIKVRGERNLGLRAYQKIIGQGGIAILVSVFYTMANPDGRIFLPFFNTFVNFGWGIAPLTFLVLVATTNSVNLTDGIDGLASGVCFVYFFFISIMIALLGKFAAVPEARELTLIAAITCGGLLCFLLLNSNKASVFMGDTGSLYLGGLVATISMFSFMGFFILILGVMFVISAASVIIQVVYFKLTKGKRVFLMSPFHHHLEKKGMNESKIVAIYMGITLMAVLVTLGVELL